VVILVENKILSRDAKGGVSYRDHVLERRILVIILLVARGRVAKKELEKCLGSAWAIGWWATVTSPLL
jgi:hypothetical protein